MTIHRLLLLRYRLARLNRRQRRAYAWYRVQEDRGCTLVLVMDRECRPRGLYDVWSN